MSMTKNNYPIPEKLNLLIFFTLLIILISLFWATAQVTSYFFIAIISLCYGIVMNTGYSLLHEAEHNLFNNNKIINDLCGTILAFFFPAPFHLIRQGHIGHHIRNRSDDEAFDFYFEGDNPVWKFIQLYGILTGFFWIVIALGNLLALFYPKALEPRWEKVDRPSQAVFESLNPKYKKLIRIEAFCILILHIALVLLFNVPLLNYFCLLFGFGFIWSAMQYVHHFGTERDVRKGARNVKTYSLIDMLWLNHNWHLNHHMNPTVPWIYLPSLYRGEEFDRTSLLLNYLKMWKGPRYTDKRVENRYKGKIIK